MTLWRLTTNYQIIIPDPAPASEGDATDHPADPLASLTSTSANPPTSTRITRARSAALSNESSNTSNGPSSSNIVTSDHVTLEKSRDITGEDMTSEEAGKLGLDEEVKPGLLFQGETLEEFDVGKYNIAEDSELQDLHKVVGWASGLLLL